MSGAYSAHAFAGQARLDQTNGLGARSKLVPAVGERLQMPADFGRRFIIFADAEEEFDWNKTISRNNVSTSAIRALPEATRRFNQAGVIPSYLLDYPVVANAESAMIMRELVQSEACDFGTQLHPWVTPPHDEDVNDFNSFTGNLPKELQYLKLKALTDQIETAIGTRPHVYRAGRYGLGPDSMTLLTEAGYRMDVSVRSRWDYSTQAGPDYSLHPVWPWRVNSQLISLPLSTAWTGPLRHLKPNTAHKLFPGTLARTRLLSLIGLTPEGFPLSDALDAIKALADDGQEIFSLSFHTPSVEIGHTPYVQCQADLANFWAWWDGVFNQFAKMSILPTRQGNIIAAAEGMPHACG